MPDIAYQHITNIFQVTSDFVERVSTKVILEEDMREEILVIATSKLEAVGRLAYAELQRILVDEKRQLNNVQPQLYRQHPERS